MARHRLKFFSVLLIAALAATSFGSVRIGTSVGLPFQCQLDGSENTFAVANMTALNGVSGLYVNKLSATGKVVFSDRVGYSPAATPFAFFLDPAGNSFTVSNMTALNGVAGLYVTKINPTGGVVYSARLGYNAAALPFSASLDTSGNVHVVSSMTALNGVAGLYCLKLNTAGASVYSVRLGTNPAPAPFQMQVDTAGNAYALANLTALNGVAGLYLTKLSSTGTTVYTGRLGYNPTAQPFGNANDSLGNSFTVGNMTALNRVSGLYFSKVSPTGSLVYSQRLGYSPTTTPFWANLDAADNAFTISNLTSLSGVAGLYYSKINASGTVIYNGRLGYNPAGAPFGAIEDSAANLYSVANMFALNGVAGLYSNKITSAGLLVYNDRLGYNPAAAPFDARIDGSSNAYSFANMTATNGIAGLYVTKLNPTGGLVFSDRLGYNPASAPFADILDSALNVYIAANMTAVTGSFGMYLTKLNSAGKVTYSVRLGTNPALAPFGYYVDGSGNAFTMVNMINLSGLPGLYLNKVSSTGVTIYSARLGTNPSTTPSNYFIDSAGNAISVTSMTALTGLPGLYVSKLSPTGATIF